MFDFRRYIDCQIENCFNRKQSKWDKQFSYCKHFLYHEGFFDIINVIMTNEQQGGHFTKNFSQTLFTNLSDGKIRKSEVI